MKTKEKQELKAILSQYKPSKEELNLINYKGTKKNLVASKGFLLGCIIAKIYNGTSTENYWWGWYKKGSGFSVSYTDGWSGGSDASSRLFFKSEELFWKAVKTFPTVYKNLME